MTWGMCRFLFLEWALHLNELTPELIAKLPPTDDRLRPDMRFMKHGYYIAVSASAFWRADVCLHKSCRCNVVPKPICECQGSI